MKITKDILKQLIKEELEAVSSELDGPEDDEDDGRDDAGADMREAQRFIRGESYSTGRTNFGEGKGPDGIWLAIKSLNRKVFELNQKIK